MVTYLPPTPTPKGRLSSLESMNKLVLTTIDKYKFEQEPGIPGGCEKSTLVSGETA